MPQFPYGSVWLNGWQFDTDPSKYDPFNWPKRQSVHRTVGGGVKVLDFGKYAKDRTLVLSSTGGKGEHQFMRQPLVESILGLHAQRGITYQLLDWLDNEFQVVLLNFTPTPRIRGNDQNGAIVQTYDYEMALLVMQITKYFGQPYTGK